MDTQSPLIPRTQQPAPLLGAAPDNHLDIALNDIEAQGTIITLHLKNLLRHTAHHLYSPMKDK
jgi:hypothetical protein